jgi:uncharacterized protein YydD (DUF2326 family)
MQGKDREWKPYLAGILGLDHKSVHEKYLLDELIDEDTKLREAQRAELFGSSVDRGELQTSIDIARDEIDRIDSQLDRFDFREEERRISKRVVDELEARIYEANEELYNLDSDIAQLERSIASGLKFDLDRITEIFDDSKVALPHAIKKSYDELVQFNRKLTRERNAALRAQVKELSVKRDGILVEHENLSAERERLLSIVRDADTFRKYKALQKENTDKRSAMSLLEVQLTRIDAVEEIERKLRDHRRRRDEYVTAIEISLQRGSPIKTTITQLFNRYVIRVLGIHGEFIVSKNKQGNIEFEIKTKDATGNDTSQDQGHSYRRLLCALFDLSVLKALEATPFYHFVYHDGIFEGLDNRVKLRLIELLKEYISDARIEYIFSIIDSDLPRQLIDEKKIEFTEEEIILALDDKGDQGRLFKMPAF